MTDQHGQGPLGTCPSCHGRGVLGEACAERICALRGYHFVPSEVVPTTPDPTAPSLEITLDPAIGQKLGDYLLTGLLGQGGFGRVYTALQMPVGMPAAVKVLEMESGPPGMAKIKLSKFETEAQAMARLSHPNIVRLYQYGHHRGAPYLAMELIDDARNLWAEVERRAAQNEPFRLDEIESILLQVLAALEAAHARQMVHRDIKPENIMLQSLPGHDLFVKILDFGLAKFTEDRKATSMLLGTPAYMAHEQLTRGPLGPWTDLFALGAVAFELLTGHRPYPGAGVQETLALKLDERYDPWSRVAHLGLPDEVHAFFAHALAREVPVRYATAAQMRTALMTALDALRAAHPDAPYTVGLGRLVEPTELHPQPPPEELPDPTRRLARPPARAGERVEPGPANPSAGLGSASVAPALTAPAPTGARRRERAGPKIGLVLVGALAVTGLVLAFALTDDDGADPSAPTPTDPSSALGEGPLGAAARVAPTPAPVRVVAGRTARGTPAHAADFRADETLHEVMVGKPLLADSTEVTQGAWLDIFGNSPSTHALCGADCPVENVGWWDAVAFANARSERDGLPPCYALRGCRGTPGDGQYSCQDARFEGVTCTGWRLPTEAEWEYLARAQSPAPDLDSVAWHRGNADASYATRRCPGRAAATPPATCGTHPVGRRAANAFGLHDLLGNVREWVHDAYGPYPDKPLLRDPTGPGGSGDRVIRGGSFLSERDLLRAAARDRAPPSTRAPDLGFRLVRTAR